MFTKDQIKGKKVLIRADLDVSVENGVVLDIFRLEKLLPSLSLCLSHASQVCIIGHRGRPKGGEDKTLSLKPISEEIKRLINQEIKFVDSGYSPGEWWEGGQKLSLLENLRFDNREENLNLDFARELSTGADVYIYEAFATYRPCTSLILVPEVIPQTLTGLNFDMEISSLSDVYSPISKPTLLIGSGAKADKKVILDQLSYKFDYSFFGGVFADKKHLTSDGLDLNGLALNELDTLIDKAETIVVNGPLGKFEDGLHYHATAHLLEKLSQSSSTKKIILGGGDTINAIKELGFNYTQYGFVSTGGGGMLEYLLTLTHPILTVLK